MFDPEVIRKMNRAGGLAFPATVELENPGGTPSTAFFLGMTLRDYFAAKAMQAWVSRGDDSGENGIAKWAYEMADAMLKARDA